MGFKEKSGGASNSASYVKVRVTNYTELVTSFPAENYKLGDKSEVEYGEDEFTSSKVVFWTSPKYGKPPGVYVVRNDVDTSPVNNYWTLFQQQTINSLKTTIFDITTDWSTFYGSNPTVEKDSLINFEGTVYKNIKGVVTSIPPQQDSLNWSIPDTSRLRYYNTTGLTITKGQVLHLKAVTFINEDWVATVELANARSWETTQGSLYFATEDCANQTISYGAKTITSLTGVNTTAWPQGSQLWLSDTTAGELTDTKPEFPSYAISCGANYDSQTEGKLFLNLTTTFEDIYASAWEGSILESLNFRVTSDGTTVTGTLENVDPTRNLTCSFVNLFTFDTTSTPATITLVPGTDTETTSNYVYIPIDTKVLTVSTVSYPTTEHCKVATLEVQSALDVQAKGGARRNQNINNHLKKEGNNGHLLHTFDWIRNQNAGWGKEGCEVTILEDSLPNGYINMTTGKVRQFHLQTIPNLVMPTTKLLVVNDPDEAYREISDLGEITKFSDGTSWNNYGKLVVWLVANKTGEPDFLCVNLPRAGEKDSSKALLDEKNRANYNIPIKYQGVGILLGAFSVDIDNGEVAYAGASVGYQDLRGTIPSNIAGGGSGGVTSFVALEDTPDTFVDQAEKVAVVNATETSLEFREVSLTKYDTGDIAENDYASRLFTITHSLATAFEDLLIQVLFKSDTTNGKYIIAANTSITRAGDVSRDSGYTLWASDINNIKISTGEEGIYYIGETGEMVPFKAEVNAYYRVIARKL